MDDALSLAVSSSDDCPECNPSPEDDGAGTEPVDAGAGGSADTSSPVAPEDASMDEPDDASTNEIVDAATDDAATEDPPALICSKAAQERGLVERSILGGTFYTYVPAIYDPATPLPLVVALHGAGDTAKSYLAYEWQANADALGVIVLAPQGSASAATGSAWVAADRTRIVAAIDDVRACYSVAPNKTVLQGFSLGADMALFTGLAYSEDFVGIAVASGSLGRAESSFNGGAALAPATRKIRVSLWRGTNDPIVSADDVADSKTRLEAAGHTVFVHSFKGAHKTTPADALVQYDELSAP